ncbi:MAG: hybrid sensor histidine kinase/response regulator [Candidatus Methanoperedenaceae archaeon]|nr:MAG: hybrid sensor histidine kinase/response regulator [Candidatus Methanoperedenaceae archaeon]
MDKKEEDFLKKLLLTFKIEAKEHLSAINEGLINLEKSSPEKETDLIETIFREAHSLKGAARSVNLKEIESLCQSMENIFASLKRKECAASPQLFDVLHRAADCVSKLISGEQEINISERKNINEVINLESVLMGVPIQKQQIEKEPKKKELIQSIPLTETVRISTAKLDSILFQAEEMLSVKLSASQRAAQLQEIGASFAVWKKEWTKIQPDIRVLAGDIQHKQENEKLLAFFNSNHDFIKSLETRLILIAKSAENDNRQFGGMVDNLLEDMKKVLMLPFSSVLGAFPKLARDLSHESGKEVELLIEGEDIEIDRRILDEMKDPLIHLLRNCIDHGIEKPDERRLKKKPPCGTIRFALTSRDGSKIEIVVSDDGAGINASLVKSAAIKRGILSLEEAGKLSEQESFPLIFRSGISTSPIITEISGRGLGLAIVREKVEKLNGIVSFETQADIGTTFRIIVPLTLATFRGLLVQVKDQLFVLPAANVERALRISSGEIRTVENLETISLNGEILSLVRLGNVLELPGKSSLDMITQIVILGSEAKHIAFVVDDILHEQEILVKSMGKLLSRVRNIAGATVFGSGRVVPILNVHDLMKSAVKTAPIKKPAVTETEAKRNTILVVEDSITSRTLLVNILETAGYDVKTTVDGLDAFTALQNQEFDLVVSDVDMPEMNGFELTAKIRADKNLSEMPVVLVTALESREHKERGIKVGANAYIVKSSFDQSNLLEIIRRLI